MYPDGLHHDAMDDPRAGDEKPAGYGKRELERDDREDPREQRAGGDPQPEPARDEAHLSPFAAARGDVAGEGERRCSDGRRADPLNQSKEGEAGGRGDPAEEGGGRCHEDEPRDDQGLPPDPVGEPAERQLEDEPGDHERAERDAEAERSFVETLVELLLERCHHGERPRHQQGRERRAEYCRGEQCTVEGPEPVRGHGAVDRDVVNPQLDQQDRKEDEGTAGEERTLRLELKLLADVGLIGLPNAGKSTLISAASAARPKVADYPFTTLVPNLGVVRYGGYLTFVMADIPGLIEGASEGQGLGTRFLRHVERTDLFLHLVDISDLQPGDPIDNFELINTELVRHNPALASKPQLVVLTRIDLAEVR